MKHVAYLAFIAAMASLAASLPVGIRSAATDASNSKPAQPGDKAQAIADKAVGLSQGIANVDVNQIVADSLGLAGSIVDSVLPKNRKGGKEPAAPAAPAPTSEPKAT